MDDDGIETYPVINDDSDAMMKRYEEIVPENMHFLGRLGKHKYLDMDKACLEAMELAEALP